MFTTQAQAKTFDGNRFTDSTSYAGTCTGPRGGTCKLLDVSATKVTYDPANPFASPSISGTTATGDDAGWFYEYVPDEKTGAGSTLVLGCATWNSLQPTNDAGGSDMCSGTAALPMTLGYLSDFVTGAPSYNCGYADEATKTIARFTKRTTTAPPATSTVRVAINTRGQVEYSTLRLDPGGAPGVKVIGTRNEVSEPVYWLEVPRDLHVCRHVDGAACR
jgi:type IV pilus assembly protein PilY1